MDQVLSIGMVDRRPSSSPTLPQLRERFALLVDQHQSSLLRIAHHLCRGDDQRAQDLVQEALISGYRSFLDGALAEGSNARAWLARILTNAFLNDYRRNKKLRNNVTLDDLDVADPADAPDADLLHGVLDEPVDQALRRLPEAQRLCVVLVDLEGLDYAEAAQTLDCPVGTIRSRLARARAALYDDLFEYAKDKGAV